MGIILTVSYHIYECGHGPIAFRSFCGFIGLDIPHHKNINSSSVWPRCMDNLSTCNMVTSISHCRQVVAVLLISRLSPPYPVLKSEYIIYGYTFGYYSRDVWLEE